MDPIHASVTAPHARIVTYRLGIHNMSANLDVVKRDGPVRVGQLSVTNCESSLSLSCKVLYSPCNSRWCHITITSAYVRATNMTTRYPGARSQYIHTQLLNLL